MPRTRVQPVGCFLTFPWSGCEMIKRVTLISASIALGCLVTIAPVLTSLYVANKDVESRDRAEVREFADKAILRAELVTYQAFAALSDLDRQPGAPCSPSNLEQAARVIYNYRYVQDAGAYADGKYLCSPLLGDVRARDLALPPPDFRSNDGFLVWFRQKSPLSDVRKDLQIGRNGRYVSMDAGAYVDLIDPARRPIAAIQTTTGTVFAVSAGADPDDMLNAWKHDGNVKSDEWNYAVARSSTRPLAVVGPRRGASSKIGRRRNSTRHSSRCRHVSTHSACPSSTGPSRNGEDCSRCGLNRRNGASGRIDPNVGSGIHRNIAAVAADLQVLAHVAQRTFLPKPYEKPRATEVGSRVQGGRTSPSGAVSRGTFHPRMPPHAERTDSYK